MAEAKTKKDKNKAKAKENKTKIKKQDDKSKVKEEKSNTKSKKKVIIITIITIFVILLACVGTGIYYYVTEEKKIEDINTTQEQSFLEFSEEVKYAQEISYSDLVSKLIDISKLKENTNIILEINDKQLSQEETFKFEELGTYKVKIKLEYLYNYSIINSITKNIENEKTIEIIIEDKEKPVINGVADKQIIVGDQINLADGITATDNVDGEVEVKIEGTVDNNKVGEYSIKVTATDKSGNIEEATFTVTVKEKPKVETNIASKNSTKSPNSSTKSSNSSTAVASSGNHVQDILRLTNQYRAEVGAKALTLDSKLSQAAQKRATELVQNCSHTRPNGTSCFTVFDEYGIMAFSYGENIAWGQANGAAAAQWWRNSPGHYANMTRSGFKKIGIGVHSQGGRLYYVQLFTD